MPSKITNVNVGKVVNQGLEASLSLRGPHATALHMDYSWQRNPDVSGIEKTLLPGGSLVFPVNVPPRHRANATLSWDQPRYFANAGATYQDVAFWTDANDPTFWGPTASFVAVNVGAGLRLFSRSVTLSVNGNNIFDERVQQHLFGDIIGRKVWAQLIYRM